MTKWEATGFRLLTMVGFAFTTAAAVSAQQISLTDADPIALGGAGERAGVYLDQGDLGQGDARRDLIIGAPGDPSRPGTVYVLFGGPVRSGEFNLSNSEVVIQGAQNGDQFGRSTAAGNILNVEGSSPRNLLVGAPGAHGGRGAVYLFSGNFPHSSRFTASDAVLEIVGAPGDLLGAAMATADLNGDAHREIIVGAPGSNRVYVVYGTATMGGVRDLTLQAADLTLSGSAVGDVLAAGDLTGDGRGDIIIGSPSNNMVFFLAGRSAGDFPPSMNLNTDADAAFFGADGGDRAGTALAVFDFDADGQRDLAIGAPGGDGPSESRTDAGEVYVIWGGSVFGSRSLSHADVTLFGTTVGGGLGSNISTGDVNRDTPNDLVVLASSASPGGELNVYYGRSRSRIGTARPDGRRQVDFASPGQLNRRIVGDTSVGPIGASFVFEVTGEGSRDIIVSVPSADANSGRIFYSISPRLRVSPKAVTVFVNRGTQQTVTLDVTNPTIIPVTWAAAVDQPWSNVGSATGSSTVTAAGRLDIRVDASALVPGQYTTTATVSSTSFDVTITLKVPVTVRVTGTQINIDSPAGSTKLPRAFRLVGWALDSSSASGTGVDAVEVYADPNPGSGTPRMFLGAATYGIARPDLAAAHGERFENSGFSYDVSGLADGTYRLLVFARNTTSNTFNAVRETVVTIDAAGLALSRGDFDGDRQVDLVWQHATMGWISAWKMNGATLKEAVLFNPSRVDDPTWVIATTGDFNGDGKPDLVWQHRARGLLSLWFMNGTTLINSVVLPGVSDPNWWIVGTADMNLDGATDLVWQHQTRGVLAIWFMNGSNIIGSAHLPESVSDINWKVAGVADMNGDGRPDLVWQHTTAGSLVTWFMNGATPIGAAFLEPRNVSSGWQISALGDLNGDGSADLIWRHEDGWVSAWFMNGTTLSEAVLLNPNRVADPEWRIVGPR